MKTVAIVVTYNGKKWVGKCFGSLINNKDTVIIAVDNGSTDGTVDLIKSAFPEVNIIINSKNYGFGKANNIGINQALKYNPDFLFLLNQDAWIENNTIEKLINAYNEHKHYSILCPLQLNGEGTLIDKYFFHNTIAKSRELISAVFFHPSVVKSTFQIETANAACWLLPVITIMQFGGFDPLYPHYGEDEDYINRLKAKGTFVGLCTNTYVYHDRETRLDKLIGKKLENKLYVSLLIELKDPTKIMSSKFRIRIDMLKLVPYIIFSKNHSFYFHLFKAKKRIIGCYNIIKSHRNQEKFSDIHYLK